MGEPAPETIEAPAPKISGHFSLYETPDGGYHIAYTNELEAVEETRHIQIPGPIVKMAQAASEGKMNPMQMIKAMRGQ